MSDNILLNIPSVDHGPGDPPHLIDIVVEEKEEKLRVATKHGFLDQWMENARAYKPLRISL